jgi:hypothetical protein
MKHDREGILGLSFLIVSLASAAYISSASIDYLQLYPALGQVDVQVQLVSFPSASVSGPFNITVQATTSNPSDYSGFQLANAMATIYFYAVSNNSITLFSGYNSVTGDQAIGHPLGPHATITTSIPVYLDKAQADQLTSFYESNNRAVMARVLLTAGLITFLNSVVGHYNVMSEQNVTLSST